MSIYIYPEFWEEPEAPAPVVLTAAQKETMKNRMKTYVNNQNRPILIKELVETAQNYILSTFGKHIPDDILVEIALEIQNEWHPPVVTEPE